MIAGPGTRLEVVVGQGWPTPRHILKAAEAIDRLSLPRYGDVLRAVVAGIERAESELPSSRFDDVKAGDIVRATRPDAQGGDEPWSVVGRAIFRPGGGDALYLGAVPLDQLAEAGYQIESIATSRNAGGGE